SHVEKALKAGFDALWIGARTTVNPFYVQEIADALSGADVPLFVKNPVNPDLKLWLGGLERIERSISNTVYPLHRGFSLSGNSRFRNSPQWQLPIELHTMRPDITLVCDPSHIAGQKQYLFEIAQKALDLNYGGLMIETHFSPETALSDSKQQITPSELSHLLSRLLQRENIKPEGPVLEYLNRQRAVIDECDVELLKLLSRRMSISQAIGELKFEHQLSVLQPDRWKEILENALSSGLELGLSNDFVDQLFKAIHDESIDQQTFLRNREEAE
nr:bifunctional 3-deoxy-7-phosphoheptulonate synthase/chorismate mutase type II [Saprospiraceae bacterium]